MYRYFSFGVALWPTLHLETKHKEGKQPLYSAVEAVENKASCTDQPPYTANATCCPPRENANNKSPTQQIIKYDKAVLIYFLP